MDDEREFNSTINFVVFVGGTIATSSSTAETWFSVIYKSVGDKNDGYFLPLFSFLAQP